MGIKAAHWNSRAIRDKITASLAVDNSIDVLCVQESLINSRVRINCKGYNIIRKDISDPGDRGICIFIRNDLPFDNVCLDKVAHPFIELQGIAVKFKNMEVLIINLYRHPQRKIPYSVWEKIFQLESDYSCVLVVGDFIAHHDFWFNSHND